MEQKQLQLQPRLQLLADMVRNGAIGLMITGGRQSFAVGGYYKSALESILPVSLEQRREVRKSSMALMVALDRSGSMAMPIGKLTKMDLANQATLEAFRQLQERDEFGLLAVDSTAHSVLPLQAVAVSARARARTAAPITSISVFIFSLLSI